MTKLGFIVEGDADAQVIRVLAERLTPAGTKLALVRAGGKIGILSASPTVAILQRKGCDHVFVLFDADTTSAEAVREEQARLTDLLVSRGVYHDVSVCPIVPNVEAWVGGGPHRQTTVGRDLPKELGSLARKADLEALRQDNESFAAFAQQVEQACAVGGPHGGA